MYKTRLLIIAIGFFSSLAFAESSDYQLEPVVVTATRTIQTRDQNIAPVIVITAQDIDQSQASDVAEILRQHAGLEIARNGGPGQVASVFVRGTNSNHVLLMVDGVKINPGTIGGPTWQYLSPQMIERIEVVKGPRSSLYGSEALGGVVNIITKRGTQGQHWQASTEFGAENTQKYAAGYQVRNASLRMGVNGESFSTDGFPSRATQDFGGGYKNNSVSAYMGYEHDRFDMELSTRQSQGFSKYVGLDENYSEVPKDQDFKNGTTALTSKLQTKNWNQTLTLSRNTNEIYQNQISRYFDYPNYSLIESLDFSVTERNALDWQNDISLGKHNLLTAGLYLSKEHDASMSFGTGYDQNTVENAAYVQDNIKLGNHKLIVAGRLTDHEDFGTQDSYNLDYGWNITSSFSVLAGVGKGFRAPNASERFGFAGNPNLKAETSMNVELGLKYKIDQYQRGTVSIFQNKIKNLINYYDADGFLGPQPGLMENIGHARIRGVEFGYSYQQHPYTFSLEGLFQTPQDEDNKQMLLRRAKRSITSRFSYDKNTSTYGIEAVYSSYRQDINDFGERVILPGYAVVNLFLVDKLDNNWALSLKIDNLFDNHYELISGYNTQGLLALMEVKYSSHDL